MVQSVPSLPLATSPRSNAPSPPSPVSSPCAGGSFSTSAVVQLSPVSAQSSHNQHFPLQQQSASANSTPMPSSPIYNQVTQVLFYRTKHQFLPCVCTSPASFCAILFSLLQAASSVCCLSGSQSGYCNITSLLLFKNEQIFSNRICSTLSSKTVLPIFWQKDVAKPSR